MGIWLSSVQKPCKVGEYDYPPIADSGGLKLREVGLRTQGDIGKIQTGDVWIGSSDSLPLWKKYLKNTMNSQPKLVCAYEA